MPNGGAIIRRRVCPSVRLSVGVQNRAAAGLILLNITVGIFAPHNLAMILHFGLQLDKNNERPTWGPNGINKNIGPYA